MNVDDLGDYRPGQGAARQHEVNAPLVDAGLTKAEIRELSRLAGLPTWDRPASACLSSRIPYGTPVTIENVKTVEVGEEAIQVARLPPVPCALPWRAGAHRDRPRGNGARADAWKWPASFTAIFKKLGFKYVTLDLEGYRQGSMNEVLKF